MPSVDDRVGDQIEQQVVGCQLLDRQLTERSRSSPSPQRGKSIFVEIPEFRDQIQRKCGLGRTIGRVAVDLLCKSALNQQPMNSWKVSFMDQQIHVGEGPGPAHSVEA